MVFFFTVFDTFFIYLVHKDEDIFILYIIILDNVYVLIVIIVVVYLFHFDWKEYLMGVYISSFLKVRVRTFKKVR